VGVEAVVAGFNAAYATDNGYRVAHHGAAIVPPGGAGGAAMPFTLPPADGTPVVVLERDGLTITAFRVNHGPVDPAVGYRFEYKGRSIVISGDTSASAAVVRNSRGADLLVHDALQPAMLSNMTRSLDAAGQRNVAQITRDIVNYHATPADAARTAQAAGVRELILTHLVPPMPSSAFYPAFLGDAGDRFDGPITVGEDGMLFSLPVGSEAIERDDRL
jgi:ribonuclease Z